MKCGTDIGDSRRAGFGIAWVIVIGCALCAVHVWWLPRIVVDDAFISYRYARNLVEGHGLVFNIGERVEGYSNFLWVMLTALGMKLGLEPIGWTRAMGAAAYIGTVALGIRLAFRLTRSLWIAMAVALLLGGSTALCGSAMSGLETGLFGFLIMAALSATFEGRLTLASTLLGLSAITRPEGLGLCVLAVVLTAAYPAGRSRRWAETARVAIPAFLLVGGLMLFRLGYYGALMPNSVQAKSAMLPLLARATWGERAALIFNEPGWGYVADFIRYTFGPVVVFAFIPIWIALRRTWRHSTVAEPMDAGAVRLKSLKATRQSRVIILAAAFSAMGLAVAVYNFGDWMSSFRLLTPYLAPLTILVALGIRTAVLRLRRRAGVAWLAPARFSAALAVLLCAVGQFQWQRPTAGGSPDLELASILSESSEPALLASTDVLGRLGYYAPKAPILDMAGLTNAHIARHGTPKPPFGRNDFAYVLSCKPHFIMNNVRTAWRRHLHRTEFRDHYWWVDRAAWTWDGAAMGKPRFVFVRRGSVLEREIRSRYSDAIFRSPSELGRTDSDGQLAVGMGR